MSIRIGGASAFYGDSQLAARQLVDKGDIDYLVFDYLAEVTMAILARAASKNAALGYAVDFVGVAMQDVIEDCANKGIKVIANAGGVNVPACVEALQKLCASKGLSLNIAGVYGDDLMPLLEGLPLESLSEMQSSAPFPSRPVSANAYFGAAPIADALRAGADIVVTGRVVDSAVTLGPLIAEFDWSLTDYNRLAQGSLCGHIIECGAQCTGGNFTDWRQVPDFANMSYPVAEVEADGSFTIGVPPGTGGIATVGSVAEQLLYEVGDPANYLLPDVACDFSHVQLEQISKDLVKVTGARGRAPGQHYKVCATWVDGFRITGSFYMAGPDSDSKAHAAMNAWLERTRVYFAQQGWPDYQRVSLETVGSEACYGPGARQANTREVMGKFGLHHQHVEALQFAAREMAYLATSGPPGMSGFGAGRARPQPLMRIHSCVLNKNLAPVTISLNNQTILERCYESSHSEPVEPVVAPTYAAQPSLNKPSYEANDLLEVELAQLVFARSGDKGDNANIAVVCRDPAYLPYIADQVSEAKVGDYFSHLIDGEVKRYFVPGLHAFNFYMTKALGGGGTASLRLDSQAKTYAQMLLSLPVQIPHAIFKP